MEMAVAVSAVGYRRGGSEPGGGDRQAGGELGLRLGDRSGVRFQSFTSVVGREGKRGWCTAAVTPRCPPRERGRAQVARPRRRAPLPPSESCWCRCRRGRRRAGAGAELKISQPPSRDPEDGRRAAAGAGARPHGESSRPRGRNEWRWEQNGARASAASPPLPKIARIGSASPRGKGREPGQRGQGVPFSSRRPPRRRAA